MSTPTWANHVPLLSGSGLKLESYPYFDPATGGVQFEAMTAALERLPPRAVVLLHASCHNPTGADLSQEQWRALLALVKRRQLVPFIDMAYQGLGESLDADAFAITDRIRVWSGASNAPSQAWNTCATGWKAGG